MQEFTASTNETELTGGRIFRNCLEGILLGIARECAADRQPDAEAFTREAEATYSLSARILGTSLPVTLTEAEAFIEKEAGRLTRFYGGLKDFAHAGEANGIPVEILEPGEYLTPTYWDTGIIPGCTVRINRKHHITAYPLSPARTEYFLTLTQGPLAADLLWITESYMLFMQQDQDPDLEVHAALAGWLRIPPFEDIHLPGFTKGIRRSNIILALSDQEGEEETLIGIMEQYGVPAVLVSGIDGFYSELYPGPDNMLPPFLDAL